MKEAISMEECAITLVPKQEAAAEDHDWLLLAKTKSPWRRNQGLASYLVAGVGLEGDEGRGER
jgi:hypothetical protein